MEMMAVMVCLGSSDGGCAVYFTLLYFAALRYVMWFCDDMMPSLAGWLAGSFATSVGGSNTYAQAQARRTAAVGC